AGRLLLRVAVDAGRDGGEGQRFRAQLVCHFEGASVAGCQQLRLAVLAVAVARSDRVEDPAGREPEARRGLDVAGGAPAERGAGVVQLPGAGGAVNGTVHATAAGE